MANNPSIIGVDPRDVTSSLVGNSTPAQQFFDRLITPPTIARELLYSSLIDGLVAAGIWALLDGLWIFAAFDHVTALTNLKASSYQATWPTNAGAFTQDRGINCSGSPQTIYLNFNPSTAGGNYAQNSACMFAWELTNTATGGDAIRLIGTQSSISPSSSGNARWAVNQSIQNDAGTTADTSGLWVANRTGASASTLTRNGATLQTSASASGALDNAIFGIGGGTDGSARIALHGIGSALNSTQLGTGTTTSLYGLLQTYLNAVGAV